MNMDDVYAQEEYLFEEGSEPKVDLNELVGLPRELVEDLRDYLWELRGEREWWKDEPRRTYQKDYAKMTADIEQLNEIIEQANSATIRKD